MLSIATKIFLLRTFVDYENPFIQFTVSFFMSIAYFVGRYVFGDFEFGISMIILVGIDTIFGAWSAKRRKDFDFKTFFDAVVQKVILYALFISAFWVLTNIKTNTGDSPLFWTDWIGYSWIAGKELVSIVKHVNFIKPGWVPKFILDKVDIFAQKAKM